MAPKAKLTEKELGLLSDLLTYEQWAMKKSGTYAGIITEPAIKDLCKSLETNHSKNYNDLFNHLNAQ